MTLLSSPQITGLDSFPIVAVNAGEGAGGQLKRIDGFITALSADTTSSVYKIIRLPTNVKIKKVLLNSKVATAGNANVNLYYSDSTVDGTNSNNQGTVITASLFGAAASLVAQTNVDLTFSGTFTPAQVNLPLWQVAGLSFDPGGNFDIVLTVTTAITTGGVILLSIEYCP